MYKHWFIGALFVGYLIALQAPLVKDMPYSYTLKKALDKKNIIPLAIVGSGPAGLTAAMYGKRLGYPTTVFTGPTPGGQLTETHAIENFPGIKKMSGNDMMRILQDQAEQVGAVILEDTVIEIKCDEWPFALRTESGLQVHALAVIIATGAAPRMLGVPGEVDYWGKGVTACSVCDGIFFKGKDVVVVGGGDTAVEEATHLTSHARSITVLVRSDTMRATPIMRDRLKDYGDTIKVLHNKQVLKIVGDGTSVTAVELLDTNTQQVELFKTDGVFLAIGRNPNTELFKPYLKLTKNGYIYCEPRSQATSVPGIYAAGDVEDEEFRQAIVAAGRGCQAVMEATSWLRDTVGLNEPEIKRNFSRFFDSTSYRSHALHG
jgi:thioredoxin reductase (NADPH)